MKGFLYTWLGLLIVMTGVLAVSLTMVWIIKVLPADTSPFLVLGLYVLCVSALCALIMSRPTPRWVTRAIEAHTRLTTRKG